MGIPKTENLRGKGSQPLYKPHRAPGGFKNRVFETANNYSTSLKIEIINNA